MSALAVAASVATLATAEGAHVVNHLPMPAWAYGAIALGLGVLLLVFTWMFRHSAAAMIEGGRGRHGQGHGSHGGSHAAQDHGAHSAAEHGGRGSH